MYKKIKDVVTGKEISGVFNTQKECWVPFDPANTDYQAYLRWLEEGNTPEPAEENQ